MRLVKSVACFRVVPLVSALLLAGAAPQVLASGSIGEHVNHMSDHLKEYSEEVVWLLGKVDGIVASYEKAGAKAAKPEAVVDHWEAVDFHSAIETNYIPLYASIWQGLYGVRTAIEEGKPVAAVRAEQEKLEQVLWQALGAVKVAAQYQERGLLAKVETISTDSPVETVAVIKQRLDRSVAKHAEKLGDEAIKIVQQTYLDLFEGIEGALIEQDAKLVEDLELDFNVTLQKAIKDGKSVDEVRKVVIAMQAKLDRARDLLKKAAESRSKVF
ncbi:MAG: hypothetical protein OIF35_04740 [Cellvibrionaceae bacterium]|nr:hypothetical protein [Cellvibrionaceae bacterium]